MRNVYELQQWNDLGWTVLSEHATEAEAVALGMQIYAEAPEVGYEVQLRIALV